MTDPKTGRFLPMPLTMERLKAGSVVNEKTGCIEWQGNKNRGGYGKITHKYKTHLTHRVAWEVTYGPIPKGLMVLHKCDNRPCVNPKHLKLGTQKDNIDDCVQKGRNAFGERQHKSVLTRHLVLQIACSKELASVVAKRLGVCVGTIYHIRNGRIWTKITGLNYAEIKRQKSPNSRRPLFLRA